MEENTNLSDKERFIEGFKNGPCTYILIGLNILIFIILELVGGIANQGAMIMYGGINSTMIIEHGQWYRLFTAMFMHFGMEHLLSNMLVLYWAGAVLERAAGTKKFIVIYFGSGIISAGLSLIVQILMGRNDLIAGASGAIFGTVGGIIAVIIVHKGRYNGITMKRILLMAAMALVSGFVTAGVDNVGHVAGLVSGIVLTFLIYGIPMINKSRTL